MARPRCSYPVWLYMYDLTSGAAAQVSPWLLGSAIKERWLNASSRDFRVSWFLLVDVFSQGIWHTSIVVDWGDVSAGLWGAWELNAV